MTEALEQIMVYNLSPGELRCETAGSLLNAYTYDLSQPTRLLYGINYMIAGGVMGIYRNQACEAFLNETPANWLLFVDSDIVFAPDSISRLYSSAISSNAQIISGVYVLPQSQLGDNVSIFTETRDENGLLRLIATLDSEYTPSSVITADGVGAGFLLIHRDVLLKLDRYGEFGHRWFGEKVYDGVIHGEDLTFCRRARGIGYQIYVDTTIPLGHVKPRVLYPSALFTEEKTNV